MVSSAAREQSECVAGRYDLVRVVGAGGNATVHEARDRVTGECLALKRLRYESMQKPNVALLFRREYRTLHDLSHPLIIRAHDYGVDDGVAYYTMELLSGGQLRGIAPLPWREACGLARDVASALALVHSRRLVHRDVTAANVFRTDDGRAKLLDFGALSPMGVAQELVGTPPFVSPEALDGRPLDGRSDLFALGALTYFLLTGEHAYPAARLSDLEQTWRYEARPPGAIVPEIPAALDTLVSSLLSLNPLTRPASAAEVFERLTTIGGLPETECPSVALSYLVAPTLVGRDGVIARFRRRMLRADRGRGSTLIIEGKPGLGRSRLLGSLVTEAKLSGMTTLYADGAEGRKGPFGVARVLARRLLEVDPARAREALLDPTMLDQLGVAEGVEAQAPPPADFRTLVDGVAQWFTRVSAGLRLVVAVDDVDDSDVPSAAIVARLAEIAPSRRLLVLTTVRSGSVGGATERLRSIGSSHALTPLRATEAKALLASVFGEAPYLEAVSSWLHQLSEGSPQSLVGLVQYLVDRQIARYEHGAWTLPDTIDGLDLPKSFDESILARIGELGPSARKLAEGLSLTVVGEPFYLDQYAIFLGADAHQLFPALNELVAASILVGSGNSYTFVHDGMRRALADAIPDERRRELHQSLAEVYRTGPNRADAIAAHHLLLAGDERAAFAALVDYVSHRSEYFAPGYRLLRSKEGALLLERLFEWGRREGVSKKELVPVGRALLGVASVAFAGMAQHAPWLVAELRRDTGLTYWDDFEGISDPSERIRACVRRAAEHAASPSAGGQRLPPMVAIREFSSVAAMLGGLYAQANEPERMLDILSQLDKLRPLSPAIDLAADVVQYAANARRGWIASEFRLRVQARSSAPIPGLDDALRFNVHILATFYQGIEEAMTGDAMFAERARYLETTLPFSALAWQVRLFGHLFRGEEKQAEICRRKRDVALVGQAEAEVQVNTSLSYELLAYVMLGDLMALKRAIPTLRARAAIMPAWTSHLLLAESAHAHLCGDPSTALELSERALELAPAGAHSAYALTAACVASLLVDLGRPEEAAERTEKTLAICRQFPILPAFVDLLEAALACAEARTGDGERATERARDVVARAEKRSTAGILLIELYAAQARVALDLKDDKVFATASKRVRELSERVDSRAFATRLSSLLHMAIGAGFEPLDPTPRRFRSRDAAAIAKVRTELELCRGLGERTQRMLGVILQQSGVSHGFLYLNRPEGVTLTASRSVDPPPIEAEEWVLRWLESFHATGAGDEETTERGTHFFGERYALVALTSAADAGLQVAAFAVLDCVHGEPRLVPEPLLREMAEVLLDAGDVARVA